jgi:hypothetical protein
VIGLTKAVAADFVGQGVRCNAICPGTVETPSLNQRLADTGDYEAARQAFTARQPMGRLGKPEELAQLASSYLASDESSLHHRPDPHHRRRLDQLTLMIDRNTLSAVGRIHAELWRRAERSGWTISPPPVLAALALDLQTTRETVSRTVSALERRGVVRRTPDALIVVAPRRLEGMID